MKFFVTGASGFIGSAIVKELIRAGHKVIGLARCDSSAQLVTSIGAKALYGSLEDIESLQRGVAQSDGVIHAGFNHDFSRYLESCETDRKAIEAIGEELAGTSRPLVVTSSVAGLSRNKELGTEEHNVDNARGKYPRISEATALELIKRKVNASVVRLAPAVHGDSDLGFKAGFVTFLIELARQKGIAAYVNEGMNLWSGVHRLDAAKIFRLAIEKGVAGVRYHGVENTSVSTKKLAEIIGKKLNVPAVSLSPEEAIKHFTWLADFVSADLAASNKLTQERLGWSPSQPDLIADIEQATL